MSNIKVTRRELLATTGAAGIGGLAGCVRSLPGQAEMLVDPEHRPDSFIKRDGDALTVDGDPVYLFGTRPAYVMNFNETKPEIPAWLFGDIVDEMFDHIVRMGGTIARVHSFQPGWGDESKQPEPGEDSEEVMRRFDRVIEAARNRGIRLVAPLINGMPPYHVADSMDDNYGVNVHTYANHASDAETFDDFFTSEECIQLYKQRVEHVLTRENTLTGVEYRNDPTIAMWELGNEIEWDRPGDRDSPSLRAWIEEVGTHVKDLDDNHLLTTGEHGWPDQRNDFTADHQPECIDVCSIHYWPGPEHYDLNNNDDVDGGHPEKLREVIRSGHEELEKPVWVGEYNWGVPAGAEPPLPERNEQLAVIHDVLDEMNVAASAFHAMGLKGHQTHERGVATTFADVDDGSMAEFSRFAENQYGKSAEGVIPPLR